MAVKSQRDSRNPEYHATVAPLGLKGSVAILSQGSTPLANDYRPFGTEQGAFNAELAIDDRPFGTEAERLKDSVYEEAADSQTMAKKQSSPAIASSPNIHHLALQSIVGEFQHDFAAEEEDSDLLANNHFRKREKIARKAVDDFHLQMVAGVRP